MVAASVLGFQGHSKTDLRRLEPYGTESLDKGKIFAGIVCKKNIEKLLGHH